MTRSTVEAIRAPATVGRTAGIAFRQCRAPVSLCIVDAVGLAPATTVIISRIAEIEKARNCGAYLFVDPKTSQAYVVDEERSVALVWIRERFGWLVGFYRTRRPADDRIPVLKPTPEGLAEDIADHLGLTA